MGDALTWKILSADAINPTSEDFHVILRSMVRSASDSKNANLRLDPSGGERGQKPTLFIKDRNDVPGANPAGFKPMPGFDPSDLIGRTYLVPPEPGDEKLSELE